MTAKKLWKDIVKEFGIPNTCTSASHILKNQYEKYLLIYEQKFFFRKPEGEIIKELGSARQKRSSSNQDSGFNFTVRKLAN